MQEEIKVWCDTLNCAPFVVSRKVPVEGVLGTRVTCPDCKAEYRISIERKPAIVAKAIVKERVIYPRREECNACQSEPDCGNAFNDFGKCIPDIF